MAPKAADIKKLVAPLKLDDLNLEYFLALYAAYCSPREIEHVNIFEPGRENTIGSVKDTKIAWPTAIADRDLMKHLPWATYESLLSRQGELSKYAAKASLWINKMQAGTGTSLTRSTYLSRLLGVPPSEVKIGAKGTDLYTDVSVDGKKASIPLAEVQILQSLLDAKAGVFSEVILQDIVSSETQAALDAIWNKQSLTHPTQTYAELATCTPGFRRAGKSFQNHIPTIDSEGSPSLNRLAPGGHALFAVDALNAALVDGRRPKSKGTLISAIGNGEDLSSTPDAAIVGWMIEKRVPIAMITTEKTENDLKGGQIAIVKNADGSTYATIIEQAQAKQSGQLKLFEELGLRKGDGVAFFNTNLALFNYDVLSPLIKKLVADVGKAEFMRMITPDLIENRKSQVDADGVTRTYVQLEGAMGSSLLRLDRVWRERYGTPLVHFVNVERKHRTRFFSPIKTAFDYFMQFHSDRFTLDPKDMRLINHRPGHLPSVTLVDKASGDKFWADVENILNAFHGASILGLDSLEVSGRVDIRNLILRGRVRVSNQSSTTVDVAARVKSGQAGVKPREESGRLILENVDLSFD